MGDLAVKLEVNAFDGLASFEVEVILLGGPIAAWIAWLDEPYQQPSGRQMVNLWLFSEQSGHPVRNSRQDQSPGRSGHDHSDAPVVSPHT